MAFKTSLALKREEISAAKRRYEVGLEKLAFATESVNAMQARTMRTSSKTGLGMDWKQCGAILPYFQRIMKDIRTTSVFPASYVTLLRTLDERLSIPRPGRARGTKAGARPVAAGHRSAYDGDSGEAAGRGAKAFGGAGGCRCGGGRGSRMSCGQEVRRGRSFGCHACAQRCHKG